MLNPLIITKARSWKRALSYLILFLIPTLENAPSDEGEHEKGEEYEGGCGDSLGGVEALRVEAELYLMLSGGQHYSA